MKKLNDHQTKISKLTSNKKFKQANKRNESLVKIICDNYNEYNEYKPMSDYEFFRELIIKAFKTIPNDQIVYVQNIKES